MTHKRLFLPDLTDEHLILLDRAATISPDGKTAKNWLEDIAVGHLALFEVPGGIIGMKREQKHIFVELLAGEGMKEHAAEVLAAVKELANGSPVEGFVVNPAVARFYQRLGFTPVGTYMRLQ